MGLVAEVGGFDSRMWRFPFFKLKVAGLRMVNLDRTRRFSLNPRI